MRPMTDTDQQTRPARRHYPAGFDPRNLGAVLSIKQAPQLSSTSAPNLAELTHGVPNATTPRRVVRVGVGDAAPDFTVERTEGGTVSLADLRGRTTLLVLARVMRTGTVCSIATGNLEQLRATYESFTDAGVDIVAVAPTNVEEARAMAEAWGLPYPLCADPDLTLFDAYDVGYLGGPPLHGWIVIDADGVVRYVRRTIDHGRIDEHTAPPAEELLAAATRLVRADA